MKTIALVDTNHGTGHHLTYMRWFCKTLLEQNHRVLCFYPEPEAVRGWLAEQAPQHIDYFHPFCLKSFRRSDLPVLGKFKKGSFIKYIQQPFLVLGQWRQAALAIAQASQELGLTPDLVFFNWLDRYLSFYLSHHWVDRIFTYPWAGLYFRPGDFRFEKLSLVPHFAIARSPHCQGLALLNEDLIDEMRQHIKQPLFAFPDLTDETLPDPDFELVQQIRTKAGHRKIIGLIGSLSKRKGILTLLEVARRSSNKDWFFVIVGNLRADMFHQDYDQVFPEEFEQVQQMAKNPPDNCFFHIGNIADGAPFNAVIDTCDLLYAAYENFQYSSNILTKAATFHKPVLVSEGYCMAKRVEQYGFGLAIPEGDVDQCIAVLDQLLDPHCLEQMHLKFDFYGYRRLHSTDQFCKIFQEILTQK
jgi:glycosyltransferase involved in cell wall biosynthesis